MTKTEQTADRLLELLQGLMRERPKLVFPDERVASLKRQLRTLKGSSAGHPEDRMFLFRILAMLRNREEPPTMGELSTELGLPLSSTTRMADNLVRARFAERCDDANDRRIVRLCLTKQGRDFMELGLAFVRQRLMRVLDRFTADEQAQLLRLAAKLLDSLQAEKPDATL